MSGMHAMMMLEVSMLGREVAPEEARPVMTMTACERGTWFSRMNLATAMAAAIAALFMQRMTTRVVSSWNANSAEPEGARAVMHDHGQSVLSKYSYRYIEICAEITLYARIIHVLWVLNCNSQGFGRWWNVVKPSVLLVVAIFVLVVVMAGGRGNA